MMVNIKITEGVEIYVANYTKIMEKLHSACQVIITDDHPAVRCTFPCIKLY